MQTVHAEAHGKIILIGEHSVVYQKGAIVAPFTQAFIDVEIQPSNGEITIDSSYHQGFFFTPGVPIEGLQVLLKAFLEKYDLPAKNLHIKITSNMLSRRGLGSSAAVAKALAEALFKYFDISYTRENLVESIQISELVYHAKPSGIDMNAVLSDDLLWYQAGKFSVIKPSFPLYLVVADSGEASQTKIAVLEVSGRVKRDEKATLEAIETLGQLSLKAKDVLENGHVDDFAELLNLAQTQLKTMGVSSARLDHLIQLAIHHGALAAKLTGGGQGGCMFALFSSSSKCDNFVKILKEQGVSQTWIMKIGH